MSHNVLKNFIIPFIDLECVDYAPDDAELKLVSVSARSEAEAQRLATLEMAFSSPCLGLDPLRSLHIQDAIGEVPQRDRKTFAECLMADAAAWLPYFSTEYRQAAVELAYLRLSGRDWQARWADYGSIREDLEKFLLQIQAAPELASASEPVIDPVSIGREELEAELALFAEREGHAGASLTNLEEVLAGLQFFLNHATKIFEFYSEVLREQSEAVDGATGVGTIAPVKRMTYLYKSVAELIHTFDAWLKAATEETRIAVV